MTRLNNRIKEQIVDNAIIKAGIIEKKASLRERRATWLEAVRIKAIGGEEVEAKIKAAEKKIKSALKGLPEDIVNGGVFRTDYDIYLNVAGCSFRAYFNGGSNYRGDQVHRITPTRYTIQQGDPLVDEFHAIESVKNELNDQETNVRANVMGALSKVGSIKKLLEMWPEAKELLPEDLSPVKKQLPAVKTEDLNAMIGLPTEA